MSRKRKSTISEAIKQGFGNEAGKKLASIFVGILVVIGLAIYGFLNGSNSPSDSSLPASNQQKIDKTNSRPSNSN